MGPAGQVLTQGAQVRHKSPNTIRIYLHAVRLLGEWAYQQDEPLDPTAITKDEIREYMSELIERTSASNAHNNYRALRTFFGFLVSEEEIDVSPIFGDKPPFVPEKPIPIVTLDTMGALLSTCKGKTFVERRDTAILRVMWDTGGRLAEVSYLRMEAVDLDTDGIWVHGKGRRDRYIPIAPKTSLALARYLSSSKLCGV